MRESLRDYGAGITLSALAHGLLFLLVALNFALGPKPFDRPVQLAIEASVVTDADIQRQRELEAQRRAAEAERLERERQAEAQRVAEEKQQAEERRRAEEQRLAVEKRQEEERIRLEQQRQKEEAERLERERQAEEQRKREEAERLEQERLAEEKRQREEAERRERERIEAERRAREAEEARRQAEREAQLAAMIAEEEQRQEAVQAGLLDQWTTVIKQRVERNWVRPPSAGAGLSCQVRVSQIPGGEVVDVRILECNGDAAVVRSIENAVYRSSPLPKPPDPSLFERTLIFVFNPKE